MKPTPEVVQSLVNLRVSPDFEVVLSYLRDQREIARDNCETIPDGVKLWREQGRSLCLKQFLELDEKSALNLQKFKSNQ